MIQALLDWAATPLSGSATHELAHWTRWHARWMVLGWGVLIPLGALAARFFKVTPGQAWPEQLDNKEWWHAHRALQTLGIVAMTVGGWLAWGRGDAVGPAVSVHIGLGWALCGVAWMQVVSGLARGSKGGPTDVQMQGDHYDMSARRLVFERAHKTLGWLTVIGAAAAIGLGLVIADAPRWMALVIGLWWFGLAIAFVVLQTRGRCIDTYQAIWGPDPAHPGNRMPPIGWGVQRYTATAWQARRGGRRHAAPSHKN